MSTGQRLHKFDALGNDFLVAFVDEWPDDAEAARSAVTWCDRHGGIGGADGLIYAVLDAAGANSVAMRLWNSDGSAAEVSGNGLRCLAHAVARRRREDEFDLTVQTDAGVRTCRIRPAGDDPGTVVGEGQMGEVASGLLPDGGAGEMLRVLEGVRGAGVASRWETRRLGNPHVVIEVPDPMAVRMHEAGPAVEALFSGGINVHFGAVAGEDELTVSVWERGAGATGACGTGAVAAASVFHDWGCVGEHVTVRMPGGDLEVDLSEPVKKLGGRSRYVGSADV